MKDENISWVWLKLSPQKVIVIYCKNVFGHFDALLGALIFEPHSDVLGFNSSSSTGLPILTAWTSQPVAVSPAKASMDVFEEEFR